MRINYIKLLRLPNLIFIGLIQFLMHFCVVTPILQEHHIEPSMNGFQLMLLIIATSFIAAGGYIINDYFDVRIDEINKPDTRIVGKHLTRKQTMTFYQIISGIGVLSGLALCIYAKSITYAFIFLMTLGLLWFYSSSYKRQLVIGNLTISALSAMVPFIVALFENRFLLLEHGLSVEMLHLNTTLMYWMGGFAFFAFIWTFIREIIKDIEDEKGDRELECHTFPVVLGVAKTKIILYVLISVSLLLGGYAVFFIIPLEGSLSWRYYLSGICIPALVLIYLIHKAQSNGDYHLCSLVTKLILFIGTLYSVLVLYLM